MMRWMGLIVAPEQTDALPPALSQIEWQWEQKTVEGGHYMDLQKLQGCRRQEDQLQECWWQEVQCWRSQR